ncbi:hypothetical protein H1R17_08475 [Flavobacterium sp. xlx-214]|uniref:hypothetical protein n=1 Tax=unclassified Flavobacterium TaxID=196869 RepID=UPI0013D11A3E|nr:MULTISPECIES: hypothetical protein [unclassified Flavobacterium]MBA5793200.1 hypothetical protein [Flavobacterium sp. xlx-221]QMI82517.1 hypothetical protein H1R17_08475 [Flavobacterium sp. xlx-214]
MNKKIIYLLTIILFTMISCNDKIIYLDDDSSFKYSEGFHLNDVITFSVNDYYLQNDTIYQNQKPVALLIKIEQRYLIGDIVLHIKDLQSNNIGRYIEK